VVKKRQPPQVTENAKITQKIECGALLNERLTSPSSTSSGKPSCERTYSKTNRESDSDGAQRIPFNAIRRLINEIFRGMTASFGQAPGLVQGVSDGMRSSHLQPRGLSSKFNHALADVSGLV
jgi:hypothetical protein